MRRTCESPGRRPSPRQESVSLPWPPDWDTQLLTVTSHPGLHICAFPSTQEFQFLASRRASNLGASLYHCPWDVPPAAIFRVVLQSTSVGHPAHWSLSGNISPLLLRHSALPLLLRGNCPNSRKQGIFMLHGYLPSSYAFEIFLFCVAM